MIGCYVLFKRLDHPIGEEMHTSFSILLESRDRYTMVMQTPVLGCFVVSLLVVYSSSFGCAYDAQYY